jgi:hypothetical protein
MMDCHVQTMSCISCRDNVLCFFVCYELCDLRIMVTVLSYGRHVSMYMIFFIFYVMYELWLWLFSFLCHV